MLRHPVKLHQAMLGIAPKGFNTVNMPRTTDKLIVTMMYPEMFGKTHINQSLITAPTVSIDDTLDTDTTSNNLLQCCFGSIGNNLGINLVASFEDAENDGFTARSAPAFTSDALCTEIGFV